MRVRQRATQGWSQAWGQAWGLTRLTIRNLSAKVTFLFWHKQLQAFSSPLCSPLWLPRSTHSHPQMPLIHHVFTIKREDSESPLINLGSEDKTVCTHNQFPSHLTPLFARLGQCHDQCHDPLLLHNRHHRTMCTLLKGNLQRLRGVSRSWNTTKASCKYIACVQGISLPRNKNNYL